MADEISTLNTEAVGQGSANTAVVDSPSQTTANDALAADDAAIWGNAQKQASDTVEKPTPVTTGQDKPGSEETGDNQAVTKPQDDKPATETTETQELTDEAIEALPESERVKARTKRQFDRLRTKVKTAEKAAEEASARERTMREKIEQEVREKMTRGNEGQVAKQTQNTIPAELAQARMQAEAKWNEIVAAVQQGTRSEADAVPVWQAVQEAYRKEGAWMAEQTLRAAQQQQANVSIVQREQTEALNTLASLAGEDPRFDMSDDVADVARRANPQTPFGRMVHELCMQQYNRPVQTWAELESFALKASKLVAQGQRRLAENKARNAENQVQAMHMRIGLESSNRHAPPPRSVKSDNSDLRKRLESPDKKIREAARYELFESEARSHGLA